MANIRKTVINVSKYILFLALGIYIFYKIYHKFSWAELWDALKKVQYFWIVVSILLGILSNISRAVRWKMLMKPLGYDPKLSNVFLSVLIMYFANLVAPRLGEVVRCSVVSKTDKMPFTKIAGTVFVERLADTLMLLTLAILIFATNLVIIREFFERNLDVLEKLHGVLSLRNGIIAGSVIVFLFVVFLIFRKKLKTDRVKEKIAELKSHFKEGIKSIARLENRWYFIGHTIFIFLMWLLMLYVVFLAYDPTKNLSLRAGMVTFLMGGLAMLAPINGGIGAWHWMVFKTLDLYGIDEKLGKIFALVAHSATNLIYIFFGGVAFLIVLFILRRERKNGLHLLDHDPVEILET